MCRPVQDTIVISTGIKSAVLVCLNQEKKMNNIQREIGERLSMLRKIHGLSQKEAAKKVNISGKTIWDYENGRSIPPADTLVAFANLYQVSTDYLLGKEADKQDSLDVIGLSDAERGAFEILASKHARLKEGR